MTHNTAAQGFEFAALVFKKLTRHSAGIVRMVDITAIPDVGFRGAGFGNSVSCLFERLLFACIVLIGVGGADFSLEARAQDGPKIDASVFNVEATSVVRGIAFSPDGNYLISAGYDKVIRVWDLGTRQSLRYIEEHWPDGTAGSIYAIALSPDGKLLAVGGYMDTTCPSPRCGNIRLYDVASGALQGVLSGHRSIILDLAFSADGRRLASTGSDRTTRIWDVGERKEVAQFLYPGDKGRASKVAFLGDNQHVVTVSDKPVVHIYQQGRKQPVVTLTANEDLHALAISDDSRQIAAGGESGKIHVWEWPTKKRRELPGNGAAISTLAFGHKESAREIVASSSDAPYTSRVFNLTTGEKLVEYPAHDNAVGASVYSPDGTKIATAGGNDWSIYVWAASAPTTGLRLAVGGQIVFAVGFIEQAREGAGRSGSDEYIAWGYQDPCPGVPSCPQVNGVLQFAMRIPGAEGGALGEPEQWPRPAAPGRIKPSSIELKATTTSAAGSLSRSTETNPKRFPKLALDGPAGRKELSTRRIDRGEDHTALSFDPPGKRIASGGRNGVLEIIDLEGERLFDLQGHSGDVWSVAFQRSGRLLISGSADQTVRIWNSQTGELIVSLLCVPKRDSVGRLQSEWIMWTPQGYFTGSAVGEDLIRAYIEQSPGQLVRLTPKNVRQHFFRPNLIERAIQLGSSVSAIEEARRDQSITNIQLRDVRLPSFKALDVELGAKTRAGTISFRLARSQEGSEVSRYTVYVNNTKVEVSQSSGSYGELTAVRFADVPLYEGKNRIRIVAETTQGQKDAGDIEVTQIGEGPLDVRETLYVVAIGVNRYPNLQGCIDHATMQQISCDLKFPKADAIAFEQMLRDQMGENKGHKKVVSRVLYNGAGEDNEPTFANIYNALNLLLNAGPRDTAVLFLAGHGTSRAGKAEYQFLPTNAQPGNPVYDNAISWDRILGVIGSTEGRRMLFIDTCRAASIFGPGAFSFVNSAFEKAVYVFLASRFDQEAQEISGFGHGAFTHFLQRGLEYGEAADHSVIRAKMLGDFVEKQVSDYTKEEQVPYAIIPPDNFVMARLPQPSPKHDQ